EQRAIELYKQLKSRPPGTLFPQGTCNRPGRESGHNFAKEPE
ncbi:hypothetical protein E2320_004966, partial [Naja naja]